MSEDRPRLVDAAKAAGILSIEDGPWPAIVDSYDADTGQATVIPTPRVRDRKSGKAYDLGPITVPVAWFGSGSVVIDSELVQGDEVLLVPCTPSIRAWLTAGGVTDGQGPGARLGESVAFPVRLSGPRRPGAPGVRLRIGDASGSGRVTIDVEAGGTVKVQASAVELGAELSPKLAVARDTDPVNSTAAFTAWRTSVEAQIVVAGGGAVTPLAGPVGTIGATSTEVTSS